LEQPVQSTRGAGESPQRAVAGAASAIAASTIKTRVTAALGGSEHGKRDMTGSSRTNRSGRV
jgi:hypothetical protein